MTLLIRDSQSCDASAIIALYPKAFPDEDLVPLVKQLLQAGSAVRSLIGVEGTSIVAHVIFTICSLKNNEAKPALLGPLAVNPSRQRQGIGSKLVRAGLHEMGAADISHIFVLGDPAYYRRFGFRKEALVNPPYPLPEEWGAAWQSLALGGKTLSRATRLTVPEPWCEPALWAP